MLLPSKRKKQNPFSSHIILTFHLGQNYSSSKNGKQKIKQITKSWPCRISSLLYTYKITVLFLLRIDFVNTALGPSGSRFCYSLLHRKICPSLLLWHLHKMFDILAISFTRRKNKTSRAAWKLWGVDGTWCAISKCKGIFTFSCPLIESMSIKDTEELR